MIDAHMELCGTGCWSAVMVGCLLGWMQIEGGPRGCGCLFHILLAILALVLVGAIIWFFVQA